MLSEIESKLYCEDKINIYIIPTPPEDWIPDAPKSEPEEPSFENVDNPGNWLQ